MMKLVINAKHGGFSLSLKAASHLRDEGHPLAIQEFAARKAWDEVTSKLNQILGDFWLIEIPRDDPSLVRLVEVMGDEASGGSARLRIVEIPDDVAWEIEECNGYEWVAEQHRTWH